VYWAAGKSWSKNLVATIRALAVQVADFKRCCMQSGEFDGSDRHYFF
jgi:hypothetical protein